MSLDLRARIILLFTRGEILPSMMSGVLRFDFVKEDGVAVQAYRFEFLADGTWMTPTEPPVAGDYTVAGMHGTSMEGCVLIMKSRTLRPSAELPSGVYFAGSLNPRASGDYLALYKKTHGNNKDEAGVIFELLARGPRKVASSCPEYGTPEVGGGTYWEQYQTARGYITHMNRGHKRWCAPPARMRLRACWVDVHAPVLYEVEQPPASFSV